MQPILYLVSCVSKKAPHAAPAGDLYQSAWFAKARAHVERMGCPWFILSAKYGLVHPDEPIAPYEVTLNRMSAAERRRWATSVLEQLLAKLSPGARVVFLAGERYREHLARELAARGFQVEAPMEGLPIGKQLQWLGSGDPPTSWRLPAVVRLYSILDELRSRTGYRRLGECHGGMAWPQRGLYFFFEDGEERTTSGSGLATVGSFVGGGMAAGLTVVAAAPVAGALVGYGAFCFYRKLSSKK